MSICYDKASNELYDELDAVCAKHHPEIKQLASIDLLTAYQSDEESIDPVLKAHGYPALAKVKIVSLKDRAKGCADIEIILDEMRFRRLAPAERAAVFDHELTHLELRISKKGSPKRDDLGRPVFRIREHDVQIGWFTEVVERHGRAAVEVMGLEQLLEAKPEQLELPGID